MNKKGYYYAAGICGATLLYLGYNRHAVNPRKRINMEINKDK